MTSVAKRFVVSVAIVGSFVAGSFGIAQAGVSVHGPFTWHGYQWPQNTSTGFTAANGYCWLSGFDLGSQINTQDQAYVYMTSGGTWVVGGAGKTSGTAPSNNAWAEAYCIDLRSGGQDLFAPSNETVAQVACPSLSDQSSAGNCYTSTNGTMSANSNHTWTDSPNFVASGWNNMFLAIMGISYDGNDGHNSAIRYNVAPFTSGASPHDIFEYAEIPVNAWVQTGDSNTQVAYGGIWPESNNYWFCAQGDSIDNQCLGVAQVVSAFTPGPQPIFDVFGDPVNANSPSGFNYVCQLNNLRTAGASGEVSARLTIDQYSQWNLTVAGPAYMGAAVSARAFCFPYPYFVHG